MADGHVGVEVDRDSSHACVSSDMHLAVCEGEAPTLVCRSSSTYALLTSPELDPDEGLRAMRLGTPSPSPGSTGDEARPAAPPKKRRDKVCPAQACSNSTWIS